ncbi:MAG: DUF1905 domain-containing protein [Dermatophilaceae bacterium]
METVEFSANLMRTEGPGGWHYVLVPRDLSDEIADLAVGPRRGFGAVRVEVGIGATTWRTSIFPDSRVGAYLLFVKQAVRTAEGIDEGDPVRVRLTVMI